jgi:ABC-type sugar transport system substrate-binding protein
MKDRLENRLRREVCHGDMSLEDAQAIATDWMAAYPRPPVIVALA